MIKVPKNQSRLLELQPETVAVDSDIFEFSFASSFPVQRDGYTEVLDLKGVDLNRVSKGAVLWLFDHQTREILGQILAVWQRGDKLYCRARLGSSDCARKYEADIRSGLLANVSCRYNIFDHREEYRGGETTVTLTSWELLEVSSAPIPADPTVGIGRSESFEHTGVKKMPTAARLNREREAAERDRIAEIQALARKYGSRLPGGVNQALELAQRGIDEDSSVDEVRGEFADLILGAGQRSQSISRPATQFDSLSQQQRGYSIAKAIKAVTEGHWKGAEFERECHEELSRQGFRSNGILVPTENLRAPALTTSPGYGGNLIGTQHLGSSFIDALRASTFLGALGVTEMNGLQGNVEIPRQSSVSNLGWIAENTDLPESEPNFDKVELTPKTVGAWTTMSRLMATQADPNIENLILQDFRNSLARELDRTAIHGSGTSNQPRGILNTSGIGSVALGANGGLPTWDSILQLEREVEADNALAGSLGFVTSVKAKSKLKGTLKNGVAGADYIWSDSPSGDGSGMLSGYKAMASTTVRSDLTKGSGSGLSAVVFGDWSSLIVATWGALSLEVDPNHDFRKGTIALRVLLFADMAVRHPQSFSAITDMVTT